MLTTFLAKHKIKKDLTTSLTGVKLKQYLMLYTGDYQPLTIGNQLTVNGFNPFGYTVFANLDTGETQIAFNVELKAPK